MASRTRSTRSGGRSADPPHLLRMITWTRLRNSPRPKHGEQVARCSAITMARPRGSSPSMNASRSLSTWSQSSPYKATLPHYIPQPLLESPSSPMQARHHRAHGDVEDLGDLLVGEPLHVRQEDGQAELLRQGRQRVLDVLVGEGRRVLLGNEGDGPLQKTSL